MLLVYIIDRVLLIITSSHHMKKTEAGLKGLCIREITLIYDCITHRVMFVPDEKKSG